LIKNSRLQRYQVQKNQEYPSSTILMLNLYHDLIIDHYKNPRNFGTLENPDIVVQEANASCGDLIEFQIKNGTAGIVPCGTTGESATLTFEEHERVIEITIAQVKNSNLNTLIRNTSSNLICHLLRTMPHSIKNNSNFTSSLSPAPSFIGINYLLRLTPD